MDENRKGTSLGHSIDILREKVEQLYQLDDETWNNVLKMDERTRILKKETESLWKAHRKMKRRMALGFGLGTVVLYVGFSCLKDYWDQFRELRTDVRNLELEKEKAEESDG